MFAPAPPHLFPRRWIAALALALSSGPALAQGAVHVVDQAGGAGSDFTQVQSAVAAAADGDVILVRSGVYGEFVVVDGRSLTLQAEAGATVSFPQLSIRNVGASQTVAVRGIDLGASQLAPSLIVQGSVGPVWIEDATITGTVNQAFPGGGTQVYDCASVVLSRCTVDSFENQFGAPGLDLQRSHVTLYETTIHGPKGFDQSGSPGNPGGVGVRMTQGTLVASGSTVIGGAGGDYIGGADPCSDGGSGGTGLSLLVQSTALFQGSDVLGGPGGGSSGACSTGATGPPTFVEPGSSLDVDARALGTLDVGSPTREGATVQASAGGEAGATAFALYALQPTAPLASPLFAGDLVVSITPLLYQPLGTLDGSGSLSLSFPAPQLPAGIEGLPLYTQLVTIAPSDGRVRVGETALVTLLDASL